MRGRRAGMSVIVATAYMEEAEQFDWLIAMNAGKVLAMGTPADIKNETGAETIENAFIRLLPPEVRARHCMLKIPPLIETVDGPVIIARGLTRKFGDFTAVDDVSFDIRRGEIFGFVGSNGCGKSTTMKMLTGLLPSSAVAYHTNNWTGQRQTSAHWKGDLPPEVAEQYLVILSVS